MGLFKTTVEGENIKNLTTKSTNLKGVVTTVYKVNGSKVSQAAREVRAKTLLDTKKKPNSLTPPK